MIRLGLKQMHVQMIVVDRTRHAHMGSLVFVCLTNASVTQVSVVLGVTKSCHCDVLTTVMIVEYVLMENVSVI